MNKLNVGDYVRTRDGIIQKITDVFSTTMEIATNKGQRIYRYIDIIKSSPNIIDLIEVGDVVKIEYQGWHQVSIKFEVLKFFDDEGTEYLYDEVTAIITKEQLENMQYKVGE